MIYNIQDTPEFGHYLIQQKLGHGGTASVYKALDKRTNEVVALKILHEHYAQDQVFHDRFKREAEIVQQLKHPGIVSVDDFGVQNKRPYLVMPYMSGGNLADYFEKPRSISIETSIHLLEQLSEAIDYAHTYGVIHRDLKLANILLDDENKPTISDFGIARTRYHERLTSTGMVVGTPQYLAPEVMGSTREDIDYRVDIYALGIMAYLMLTGYFPFTGDDPMQIVFKHKSELPPRPSLVNPELPHRTDDVLRKVLAKKPNNRYQSAKDFVEALKNATISKQPVITQILLTADNPAISTTNADLANKKNYETIIFSEDKNDLTINYDASSDFASSSAPTKKTKKSGVAGRFIASGIILLFLVMSVVGIGTYLSDQNSTVAPLIIPTNDPTEDNTALIVAETEDVPTLDQPTEDAQETGVPPTDISFALFAITSPTDEPTNTSLPITPTDEPSATPTTEPTNTPIPTDEPSETPTDLPPTPTDRPSKTPTDQPTHTPIPPTATLVPTETSSNTPTDRPTNTNTPTPTVTSSATPTNRPTNTPRPPTETLVPTATRWVAGWVTDLDTQSTLEAATIPNIGPADSQNSGGVGNKCDQVTDC